MVSIYFRRATSAAALFMFVSTAGAGDMYPSVDSTALWKYSDETYSSGPFQSVASGTPTHPFGFDNEAAFNVAWVPPGALPIQAEFSYGHSDNTYITSPSPAYEGDYVAFGSLYANPYGGNPMSKFIWRISGAFNDQHEQGQHYLFQADVPEFGNQMIAGSSFEVKFYANGTLKKSAVYQQGTGDPDIGWDAVTWNSTNDHSGQSWELIIKNYGQTGYAGMDGGIGSYMELGGETPVPGPGIAMACAVGLVGIKRRRRRH